MPSCLTLSIIRRESRVKWSNTGNGVALPTPWCCSYRKREPSGHLRVTFGSPSKKGTFGSPTLFWPDIGLMVRVLANGMEDLGSISGWVIPKTQKWYLMLPCLTLIIIMYGSRVKWGNLGKGVASCPKPWCSCYWKGSLQVTLDYGHQLYLLTQIPMSIARLEK